MHMTGTIYLVLKALPTLTSRLDCYKWTYKGKRAVLRVQCPPCTQFNGFCTFQSGCPSVSPIVFAFQVCFSMAGLSSGAAKAAAGTRQSAGLAAKALAQPAEPGTFLLPLKPHKEGNPEPHAVQCASNP